MTTDVSRKSVVFVFFMHVPRIELPYPIFSVVLFELHTGVSSRPGVHMTKHQVLVSEATDITCKDTI